MNDDETGNHTQDLTEADVMAELMDLISQPGIRDNKLRKILDYVERVLSEPD
jgi:hypothetical protein